MFAFSVQALATIAAIFLAFPGAILIGTVCLNSIITFELVASVWVVIAATILSIEIVGAIFRAAMLTYQITAAIILAAVKAAIVVALILYQLTVSIVQTPYLHFCQWVEWRKKRKLAAIRLQAFTRGVLAHKKHYPTIQERLRAREKKRNNAAVKIQSVFRRHQARKKLEELQATKELRLAIQSAIKIEAMVRGQSATTIQSVFRRHQARNKLEKLRRETNAAVVIQSVHRGYQAKKRFQLLKSVTIRIQGAARGRQARNAFARQLAGVRLLQARVRGALVRARVKRAHAKQCHNRFSGIFGAMLQILMYLVMIYGLYTPPTTTIFLDSMAKPFEDTMVKFLPLADDEIKTFIQKTQAAVEIQRMWRAYKGREVYRIKRYGLWLAENPVDHKKILKQCWKYKEMTKSGIHPMKSPLSASDDDGTKPGKLPSYLSATKKGEMDWFQARREKWNSTPRRKLELPHIKPNTSTDTMSC